MPTFTVDEIVYIALGATTLIIAILLIITMARLKRLSNWVADNLSPQPSDEDISASVRDDLRQSMTQASRQISALNLAQQRNLNRVGLVRFNPYEDTGGDLSFSLALATSDGNGVLITSLHGRTTTRFYAKPLQNWNSNYTLSDEEAEAIRRAQELHLAAVPGER